MVDADAVALGNDVGGGVQADADGLLEAREVLVEDGRGKGGGAAFALGAGDVDDVEGA